MRHATLKTLRIGWAYWLVPCGFGAAGIVALAAVESEPGSRLELALFGMFFLSVTALAVLWPWLRTRESYGTEFLSVPTSRVPFTGTFIRASKSKLIITAVGGSIFGLFALLAAMFAGDAGHRIKGGVAFLAYLFLGAGFLRANLARRPGILLTEQGVVWNDWMYGTGLICWDRIARAEVYEHKENGRAVPTFGMFVDDLSALQIPRGTRSKLETSLRRWGWHCYYHAESLLLPLEAVAAAVAFYRSHPEARVELVNGAAVDRIDAMASMGAG